MKTVQAEDKSWRGTVGNRAEEADEFGNKSGSGVDSSGGEDAVGSVGASDLGGGTRVGIRASALVGVRRGSVVEAVAITTVLDSEIFGGATSGVAKDVSHLIAVEDIGLGSSGNWNLVGATDVVVVFWRRVVGAVTCSRLLIVSSCRSSRSDCLMSAMFKAV